MPDAASESQRFASTFRIGRSIVDPIECTISSSTGSVAVNNKSVQVLLCLAKKAPQLVTRRELLDEVWAGVFVSEAVLTTAVWELRRKLGSDDSDELIETLRGKGYRLREQPKPIEVNLLPRVLPPKTRRAWTLLCAALIMSAGLLSLFSQNREASLRAELAEALFVEASQLTQSASPDHEVAARLLNLSTEVDSSHAPTHLAILDQALESNPRNLEVAKHAAEDAVRAAPRWDRSYLARARVGVIEGVEPELFAVDVERAVAANPGSAEARLRLAQVRGLQGRSIEGLKEVERALARIPKNESTHRWRTRVDRVLRELGVSETYGSLWEP